MNARVSLTKTLFLSGVLAASLTLSACATTQTGGGLQTGSSSASSAVDFNSVSAYPKPTIIHVYNAQFDVNPQASASQRRLYVDLINVSTGKDGYAPRYYVITAGQDDVTLVAVAAQKKYLENIYQARAGLHRFGASARLLPNGSDFTYRIDLQKKKS